MEEDEYKKACVELMHQSTLIRFLSKLLISFFSSTNPLAFCMYNPNRKLYMQNHQMAADFFKKETKFNEERKKWRYRFLSYQDLNLLLSKNSDLCMPKSSSEVIRTKPINDCSRPTVYVIPRIGSAPVLSNSCMPESS